jgi:hypothetical protein
VVIQSCTTFSVLPKNVSNRSDIEGVYSNISKCDTLKFLLEEGWWENMNILKVDYYLKHPYETRTTIWGKLDTKHEIKTDSIIVKTEIVNSKRIKFSFIRNDEIIGTKLLKGKFKKNECFYTRRIFYIVPVHPIMLGWTNFQERIYRIDNELIIETVENEGGLVFYILPTAGNNRENDIWKFKRLEN